MTKNSVNIPQSKLPHGTETVLASGNVINPTKALLLLHGRGATAEDILRIVSYLDLQNDVLVFAPQAANNTWYPARFIEPQAVNQPDLDSALERIRTILTFVENEFQISPSQIVLAGFSQGACLVSEYTKQNPKQYKGVGIFSGGLIGNEEEVAKIYTGSFYNTPFYIGCDKEDFHIPYNRVQTTASYFIDRHADVTLKIYTNLGHTIHPDGIAFIEKALRD